MPRYAILEKELRTGLMRPGDLAVELLAAALDQMHVVAKANWAHMNADHSPDTAELLEVAVLGAEEAAEDITIFARRARLLSAYENGRVTPDLLDTDEDLRGFGGAFVSLAEVGSAAAPVVGPVAT